MEIDKNKIVRNRPSMRYSMIIKQIAEPSNATIIDEIEGDRALKLLQKHLTYNQVFYLEKKFFIFYKDDYKKKSFIDIIEYEENNLIKQDESSNLTHAHFRNKEIISNILKFDINKEVYSIQKIPSTLKHQSHEFDISNLFKETEYENLVPRNINYLDSNENFSCSCMHIFATQMFSAPEETVVMTSSELVYLSKLRPIDLLFKILTESDSTTAFDYDYSNFINDYGLNETAVMLLTIMSNRNFIFYRKYEETIVNESHSENNLITNVNVSSILMMDTNEVKNNDKLIDIATNNYVKLIDVAFQTFNINLKGVNVSDDGKKSVEKLRGLKQSEIAIGQPITDLQSSRINFISYSLYMYLARISRLLWEEYIYNRMPDSMDNCLNESIKVPQMKFLQCLLNDFLTKVKEIKDTILQKSSEIDLKLRSLSSSSNNLFDFTNLSKEFEEVTYIAEKLLETLRFVEILYEMNSLKKHCSKLPRNLLKEMASIKFKDVIKNNQTILLKQWVEEFFEVAICENDYMSVGNKLDEMADLCPNIINKNDKELITANLLIKLSKTKQNDEITRKNMITKAIKLMTQNPENIRLEKMIKILGELGEIRAIVQICVQKAIYLKALLDRETERIKSINIDSLSKLNINPKQSKGSLLSVSLGPTEKDNYFNEYKHCLYSVLKLLNEVHLSIKNHDRPYDSTAPDYIKGIIQGKKYTLEEKLNMQNAIIEEILKYDMKFLHDLLFDHLKSQDMLDDIVKYNSPYIESYLSAQIEKENTNPKRYVALYKFYLNSKNYEGALRILMQLFNFDNTKIEYTNNTDKYVNLDDRRTYIKHLLYTIDLILEAEKEEERKNFYLKLKSNLTGLRDTLMIQEEIFISLKHYYESLPVGKGESVREAIDDLDKFTFTLEELYYKFSKRFKLYEINFQIYFEMFNKNFEIDAGEVRENYDNYFSLILNQHEGQIKWPFVIIPILNKIFVTLVETKTPFESFFTLVKENGYNNTIDRVIPLDFLIKKIENINWNILVKEKEIDYEQKSNGRYDTIDNPFWFAQFLRDVVKLPAFYIFRLYNVCYDASTAENEMLQLILNIMQTIKLWCNNVEVFILRIEKKDSKVTNIIYDDYNEFIKAKSFLQDFMEQIYVKEYFFNFIFL